MAEPPFRQLVELLARLPGVGERTATRLAFFILESEPQYASLLGDELKDLHHKIRKCDRCQNYTTTPLCDLCSDSRRNDTELCVVARVPDLMAIERTSLFKGRYFVLHSLLSPLDGKGPATLETPQLMERLSDPALVEIVLATPLTVEGEATALFLTELAKRSGKEVSRLASGLPHGGELEFADHITLSRAFGGRKKLS